MVNINNHTENPIELYKYVLSNKLYKFPTNYWRRKEAKDNAIKIMHYLFEDYLGLSRVEILNKVTTEFFIQYRLERMFTILFNKSRFKVINAVYPNRFKPWEFSKVPRNYWNLKTAKEATKWLIEEKLKWTDEDVKTKLTLSLMRVYNLGGMVRIMFDNSPYKMLENAYPGKFKPWELLTVPQGYWTKETVTELVHHLVNEVYEIKPSEIPRVLTKPWFNANGLGSPLCSLYSGSPYRAVMDIFPNRYKQSDFKKDYLNE